jgi:hypothetical protein
MTRRRFMPIITMALTIPVASLGMASSALAAPQGIYAVFANCPTITIEALTRPESSEPLCQYGQITGGEIAIGSTKVPIDQTITLQDGAVATGDREETETEFYLMPAVGGPSISETELNVPGGLSSLVSCDEIQGRGIAEKIERRTCRALFKSRFSRVTASIELVANAQDPALFNELAAITGKGPANTLPIRVHLRSPLLGNDCYIGSESSPIVLHLTTGATSPLPPNTSISGAFGQARTLEEDGELALQVTGTSLVDNAFSVPVAEGCGGPLSSIVDPLVDLKLKLPSPDGNNTAILDGTFTTATAEAVVASESFPPSSTPETPPGETEEENHHRGHHHHHVPWRS